MLTRRVVLRNGLQAAAATGLLCASIVPAAFLESGQQPASNPKSPAPSTSDAMTIDSAPRPQQHFAPPDFGPLPKTLPPEAKALRGRHSLLHHARKHGLIAGAAIVVHGLQEDPVLQQLVADQYGILVPEGELKWRALRPSAGRFDFVASDALFSFAQQHRILVRGHTLVWHNSVPDWLQNRSAKYNVRQLLIEHIHTVMGRYRGRVQSWDVVNEAILPKDAQPGGLRKSFWYDAIGPDYIELAFRTAREADPHARLTYNDYGVEYDSDEDAERRDAILGLLRRLQERKVPLDAVGIQSHIKAASPYTIGKGLTEYMDAIRSMGLEIYLTEMDVNEDDITSNDVQQRDAAVAQTYRDFLNVALANPSVKLMLTWGVSDRRTWLNDGPTHHRKQPNRPQRSLPFDPQYRPASAFFAIRSSFDSRFVSTRRE